MPKYTIRVEIKNLHSYEGEFATEQEAFDYATLMCQEHNLETLDGWNWDDGLFEVYHIKEGTRHG